MPSFSVTAAADGGATLGLQEEKAWPSASPQEPTPRTAAPVGDAGAGNAARYSNRFAAELDGKQAVRLHAPCALLELAQTWPCRGVRSTMRILMRTSYVASNVLSCCSFAEEASGVNSHSVSPSSCSSLACLDQLDLPANQFQESVRDGQRPRMQGREVSVCAMQGQSSAISL